MKIKARKKFIVKISFLIFELLILYMFGCGSKLVYEAGGKNFEYYISNGSYYAIQSVINQNLDFSELYTIQTNDAGDIVMVNTNSGLVNCVATDLANACFSHMDEFVASGFSVPIGAFSGINLLAGLGPKINVKLISVLSVDCRIKRSFTSAGINQTRQTLSAIINTDITVYSLLKNRYYSGEVEVMLYDNVIVGKVPETYLVTEIIGVGTKKE